VEGFIAYARKDRAMLDGLLERLDPDMRKGIGPKYWADPAIEGGQKWNKKIEAAIERAEVFLLLVSPGFLFSDYIYRIELPAIRARAARCDGLVVPVLVEKCMWEQHLAEYDNHAVPTIGPWLKAIRDCRPQRDGFHEAHVQLCAAVKAFKTDRRGSVP